jgi:hypothetical protein
MRSVGLSFPTPRVAFSIGLCATIAVIGCHHTGHGGAPGIDGLMTITVSPATATLTIAGGIAATQSYTAQGSFTDGHTADITSKVTWTVGDTSLGSFAGAQFTSDTDHGGKTAAVATAGSISGSGTLIIVLQERYQDPGSTGLPPNPGTVFNGPPSTTDLNEPRLVYPDDNVLVPPNLGTLEVHFTAGGDGTVSPPNTLFELSFENAVTDVKVYMRCPKPPAYTDSAATPAELTVAYGCIYTTDATLWRWLAQTNRGGDPVTVSVRGSDDSGTAVGSSNETHVSFSFDDIQGALYYWEIGDDKPCVDNNPPSGRSGPGCADNGGQDGNDTAIVRFDFAGSNSAGTTFLTPATPGSVGSGTCLGCHALSHDGTKLIAEAGGQYDGRTLLWNVAKQTATVPFGQVDRSIFESWNPDGSQYVAVNDLPTDPSQDGVAGPQAATCTSNGGGCDINLRIYDGTTGKFVSDIPNTAVNGKPSDHPDWSLDGNLIAYDTVGSAATLQQAWNGTLYVVSQSGGSWSAPVAVATPPDDHTSYYYPTLAPDNSIVAFDRAVCPPGSNLDTTCWFDTAPTSRLFAATPTANATLVELVNANKPGPMDGSNVNIVNSYPKFSPYVFRRSDELSSKLMWMTFASKRRFGLRAPPAVLSKAPNIDADVLWMVGVDPVKIAAGQDGSFVAFALPFQRFYKSNHIAQWTSKIVPPIS